MATHPAEWSDKSASGGGCLNMRTAHIDSIIRKGEICMDQKKVMEKMEQCGIVPVAVIDTAEKAVPLANAMLAGGVDVIEVTFRTSAAAEAIQAISRSCEDMLVGAGTVITLEQCKLAVESGAAFIVSPGFSHDVVSWCVEHEIPVVPGCVTATEITTALAYGLRVIKFFPSNIYGGLTAMKALSAPFAGIRFIPTSGINAENVAEFVRAPFIFAPGGSWVCPKAEIEAENYEKITALCRETRKRVLGFELGHIGINADSEAHARDICMAFQSAFDFPYRPGTGASDFSSSDIEIKKRAGRGTHGHLAVKTNSLPCAIAEMRRRGIALDESSWTYDKTGNLIAVFLQDEIGGFAVHLLQK